VETIKFDDFAKVEIRIGKILSAEKVENSEKLLKLEVDFGFESVEIQTMDLNEKEGNEAVKKELIPIKRQIIAGIAQFYAPEALIGKECPFAYNLAPRKLAGLESQGMILCPSDSTSGPVLLHPDKQIEPGSLVK
jgi:tRNA-binding EMAP/Myf-like protein